MLKYGKITDVDATKGLARVTLEENDNMVTDWLPMSMPKTLKDKFILPFDINEHVWCIMDDKCESGVIGGAIYDNDNLPDGGDNDKLRIKLDGNLYVDYTRSSGTLSITGTGKINIDIDGDCNIKCQKSVIESLTDLEIKAATQIKLTAPEVVVSQKLTAENVVATVEVKAGVLEIPLTTHKHIGVTSGPSSTGTPIP